MGRLKYEPPSITLVGNVDQFAFDAIEAAYKRLTESGIRVTLFRLREEARRELNLIAVSDETIAKAADRFSKSQGLFESQGR